jgi:uncharacterized protein (DUF1330 family)
MKMLYTVSLAAISGAIVGAAAISALHAQGTKPGYAIVDISEVTDPEAFKGITNSPTTTPAGMAPLGWALHHTNREYYCPGRNPAEAVCCVIQFDSVEKAKAWNATPQLAEINAIRAKAAKSRSFVVEGF